MFYMDGDTDSVEEDVKELASGLVETYLLDTVQDMHRTTFRDDMICDVVKMIKCQLQNLHEHIDEDMVETVTSGCSERGLWKRGARQVHDP